MTSGRVGMSDYQSPVRRRARSVGRLIAVATRPSTYRHPTAVKAYWWDGHKNFGDALTPWLLPRYGLVPVYTRASRANLAGVGSILEQLPADFCGAVWGSGLLYGRRINLAQASFLALRGELTRDILGVSDEIALGDPGLLVSRHLPPRPKRWQLGVVPHGFHDRRPEFQRLVSTNRESVTLISVAQSPRRVINQISSCRAVLTTSLHGLVVADSYGIPALWGVMEPALWGGEFKFHDYESLFGHGIRRRFAVPPNIDVQEILTMAHALDSRLLGRTIAALESTIPLIPTSRVRDVLAQRIRREDQRG